MRAIDLFHRPTNRPREVIIDDRGFVLPISRTRRLVARERPDWVHVMHSEDDANYIDSLARLIRESASIARSSASSGTAQCSATQYELDLH